MGKALEHAGLTTGDSEALIARQERAHYEVAGSAALSTELDALHSHVLAVAKSGALSERTRKVVETNGAKSAKHGKARKPA